MSQNTAASYGALSKAEAGSKYDVRPDVVSSRAAEGAVAFGLAVTYGTDPEKQCEVVDNASDTFLGVALKTHTVVVAAGATPGYADEDSVSVLEQGAVWVEVTSAVAAGAPAYVDVSNAKFTDVSTDNLAVPNGSFETSAESGGLAVLKIK